MIDDNGSETWWIMAPKPTYTVPFDLRQDELVIIQSDTKDQTGKLQNVPLTEATLQAQFWNIEGDSFSEESCLLLLKDEDDVPSWDTFELTAPDDDADGCATYAGQTGKVGYTEEIDTYVYLEFDDSGEKWRFATYQEMYNTVDNGGLFPWDDNAPSDNIFKGMKAGAFKTVASLIAISTAAALYV